jgi:hypothetical protein
MMTLLSLQAKLVALDTEVWRMCYSDQQSKARDREAIWNSFIEIHREQAPGNVRAQTLQKAQDTLKEYCQSKEPNLLRCS